VRRFFSDGSEEGRVKSLSSFLTAVVLGCSPIPAAAAADEAEAAIRAQLDGWARAWNAEDAAGLAAYYTPDAVRVFAHGTVSTGRDTVRSLYERAFAVPAPEGIERRLTLQVRSVRLLRDDVAVVDYEYRATAIPVFPEGATRPVLVPKVAGRATVVMVRQEDQWLRSVQSNWIPMTPDCLQCLRE
jgi:uncharacterized protein (TIGR02246 family)